MTRGAQGSLWVDANGAGTVATHTVTAIDTVAAGDAFCGGLVSALAEGQDLQSALRRASAAGALTTTKVGAVPSLPTLVEVQALLA
jgi:ribokinase